MNIIKAIENSTRTAQERNWDTVYWAVDLHGTISKFNYSNEDLNPDYYPYAKQTLQLLSKRKDIKLILFTCSYEENCERILNIMKEDDIIFDYVNENPEAENTGYGDYTKKIYFNVLLEDKGGFEPELDWKDIYEYLSECLQNDSDNKKTRRKLFKSVEHDTLVSCSECGNERAIGHTCKSNVNGKRICIDCIERL